MILVKFSSEGQRQLLPARQQNFFNAVTTVSLFVSGMEMP